LVNLDEWASLRKLQSPIRKRDRPDPRRASSTREGLCSEGTIWDQKSGVIFVRYSREFVITVIVITEFECILKNLSKPQ